jgi:predicted nucleic acid-binding protein
MKLADEIPDGASVLVDTNPIIYVFEGNPLAAQFKGVFADIESGRIQAIVTPITIAEIVCGPMKAGNEALAERYRYALCAGSGWALREIDADIAMLAARLRLQHRIKLPDALQLATAVHEGCHSLLTYDRDFGDGTVVKILGPKPRKQN